MNYLPLLGIAVIVIGFVLRFNPVLVVVTAAIASGLLAGLTAADLLALLGESFVSSRMLMLFVLTLPVIGLLEHAGLPLREDRVENVEIGLVVEPEGAAVEVGRTHRRPPVVHHHHLHVVHRGLVFVDRDTRLEQLPP